MPRRAQAPSHLENRSQAVRRAPRSLGSRRFRPGVTHIAGLAGALARVTGVIDRGDRDRAQLDQAQLARQAHDLHEQLAELLEMRNARKSRIVRCAGKLLAASTRNATSSCSLRAILRELKTPVAYP